ncbi:MAG: hypothetical protein PHP11_00475 [Erysipelotrichaceae bacterium]|nr:hypothetical protein [Erysipelotrichaceae bacterium]MDD3923563.1 hypothetical protein [Erysipelotrichaceae bacterium]
MASIVYLTDRKMIEYHRLNGNRTMNFWRPTTNRRIVDFHPGDLLFFLSKGTERGIAKEKGIVGYGRYQKAHTLTFNQMWKIYGTQNGYDQQQELYDAIIKISKNKKMPKTLNCLYLEDIVYFQAPIYLSEIGVKISKMIESYFYLDKDDPMATAKILSKAKEVGIDRWSAIINDQDIGVQAFEEDYCKHIVSEALNELSGIYNDSEEKKAHRLCNSLYKEFIDQDIKAEMIKGNRHALIIVDRMLIRIFIPMISSTKDIIIKTQLLIGHVKVLEAMLMKKLKDKTIDISVVIDADINKDHLEMLHLSKVNYLLHSSKQEKQ